MKLLLIALQSVFPRALFLCMAFFAAVAHANPQVLFIDLNNAEDEVDAIVSVFPKKSANVVVAPPLSRFSEKRREQILKTKAEYDKTLAKAEVCTLKDKKTCPPLWEKLRTLELERERLTGAYGLNQLVEDLMPHQHRSFDIVVISGHHSGGFFRGEIAELEIADLRKIDLAFPALFAKARTVILLGCETGTPEMFRDVFPTVFPRANLIIGSEDNAPTRSEARNLSFIRAVLKAEPQLQSARERDTVNRIHREFLSHRWPATILWRQDQYFAKRWNGHIKDAEQGVYLADVEADEKNPTPPPASTQTAAPKKKKRGDS